MEHENLDAMVENAPYYDGTKDASLISIVVTAGTLKAARAELSALLAENERLRDDGNRLADAAKQIRSACMADSFVKVEGDLIGQVLFGTAAEAVDAALEAHNTLAPTCACKLLSVMGGETWEWDGTCTVHAPKEPKP